MRRTRGILALVSLSSPGCCFGLVNGSGAGFYVNATQEGFSNQGYNMYDYVTQELPTLLAVRFVYRA